MKIICIGRNYAEHAKELNNPLPTEPVFFMKPDTALIENNHPFYYPDFTKDLHHEIEVVLKISKQGKNISEKFANKYYEKISVGIDFTARDLQTQCKEKGLPWEKAKSFDGSAPVGSFVDLKNYSDANNLNFELLVNNETRQKGNTKDLIFNFDKVISYVSQFVTLRPGDLIYTGTPEGVGAVKIGDTLEAKLEGESLLKFVIK